MQFDKNSVERLLRLNDEALWTVIRTIAAQSGLSLPSDAKPEELAAIRQALGGASEKDIHAATELLKKYKPENGG